jgi:glycolate oxidase FAD binding subunit
MLFFAKDIDEVQSHIRATPAVRAVGGGTKTNLSRDATISLREMSGIVDYRSDEYIISALAGTPLAVVESLLAEKGQSLPFDPLFVKRGATLGGTVASGLSGPGRWRYGGLRDFILSVQLVSGAGRIIRGGANVVKNAAGFDIPKLVGGSLGCFGILTEVTFKVFPTPKETVTLKIEFPDTHSAVKMLCAIAAGPWELMALELSPPSTLWIRLGGQRAAVAKRIDRISATLLQANKTERLTDDDSIWAEAKELDWLPDGMSLLKVPVTPREIVDIEAACDADHATFPRRYSCGGNVLYLGYQDDFVGLMSQFHTKAGMIVLGNDARTFIGKSNANVFGQRLRAVFDPDNKLSRETFSLCG